MKINTLLAGILVIFAAGVSTAQQKMTIEEYIDRYKDLAVAEMNKSRIPASITLAQGILESNCGNSPLALEANNHFGIKCHKEWTGKTFYQDDDEKHECFRKYNSAEDSYRDHSDFLVTRDRYNLLFDLDITDYKGWAHGLKQAGYATNPKYPELLIKIIEENRLYLFDKVSTATQNSPTHHSNSKLKTQDSKLSSIPPDVFDIAGNGGNNRIIFINNGVKFIFAREGDDPYLIAMEFEIYSWQIFSYNEMTKHDIIVPGQKVYLEKKKRKAAYDYHVVRMNEDLRSIAQDYGIRLKSLYRLNDLEEGNDVKTGTELRLR